MGKSQNLGSGDVIDGYRLKSKLGSGGNAEVWRAWGPDNQLVALKFLKKNSGSSYERFKDEIQALQDLRDVAGVIPFVKANADASGISWLAMKIGERLSKSLKTNQLSLEEIILGFLELSETLNELHIRGYSHRDIKPDNILLFEGRWTLGDFGLVDYPEKEFSTPKSHQKLGPLHYLAPEMLLSAGSAQGQPADIYSLAKTMWVVITGQTYPAPGQLCRIDDYTNLEKWIAHPRATFLNGVLSRCTDNSPNRRLTANRLVDELRSWLNSGKKNESPTYSIIELIPQMDTASTPFQEKELREKKNQEYLKMVFSEFQRAIKPQVENLQRELEGKAWELNPTTGFWLREAFGRNYIGCPPSFGVETWGLQIGPRDNQCFRSGIYAKGYGVIDPETSEEFVTAAFMHEVVIPYPYLGQDYKTATAEKNIPLHSTKMQSEIEKLATAYAESLPKVFADFIRSLQKEGIQ